MGNLIDCAINWESSSRKEIQNKGPITNDSMILLDFSIMNDLSISWHYLSNAMWVMAWSSMITEWVKKIVVKGNREEKGKKRKKKREMEEQIFFR